MRIGLAISLLAVLKSSCADLSSPSDGGVTPRTGVTRNLLKNRRPEPAPPAAPLPNSMIEGTGSLVVGPVPLTGSSPFVRIIDDEIICEEVNQSNGLSVDENGSIKHFKDYFCAVEEKFTTNGTTGGISMKLLNLPLAFEDEFRTAKTNGRTSLVIRTGFIDKASLSFSNLASPEGRTVSKSDFWTEMAVSSSNKTGVPEFQKNMLVGGAISIKPVLQWIAPLSSARQTARKLATNTTGKRNVLVFRVTTNGLSPSITAEEISNAVFGTGDDTVNLSSQYLACSYNKLNFTYAVGAELNSFLVANGVIDINVANAATTFEAANAAIAKAQSTVENGGMGLRMRDYNHVLFQLPASDDFADSNYIAYAIVRGKYAVYNDEWILDVQTLVHETGHNLGLQHSGEDDPNDSQEEYADSTGYMGYTNGDGDRQKCFNGAKMAELGWYAGDKNRVATIKPSFNEEFNGKLIGVADFGLSNEDHTVVLEVISPDSSNKPLYYLAYNRAKGINRGTSEARNQVTIVEGRAEELSFLRYKINPGNFISIPDYHHGKSLDISVGKAMSDSFVDYVPVSVRLHRDPSSMASSAPSATVTAMPSIESSNTPSVTASVQPSLIASSVPSMTLTAVPSLEASNAPIVTASVQPSLIASSAPSMALTAVPSLGASNAPSETASLQPSFIASSAPSVTVTAVPSIEASNAPSETASLQPSVKPSSAPSMTVTSVPSIEASDVPSDTASLQPSEMPSSAPSSTVTVTSVPSIEASNTPSDTASLQPSVITDEVNKSEFLIKTVYDAYSSQSEWCVTAEFKDTDSKIYVIQCKDYSRRSENLQLWGIDVDGHIKLAGPAQDDYCITSLSRSLVIRACANDIKAQVFNLNEIEGTVSQTKESGEVLFIGIDDVRIFSKLKLFQDGSINATLTTWRLKYGNAD